MNSRYYNHRSFWFGWGLAGLFFFYYALLSNSLPLGAGPDYRAHNEVTAFIVEHGRLAMLPEDEDALYFTPYGGTRASRPPLAYLVSAVMVKLSGQDAGNAGAKDFRLAARKGSALLVALAVMVLFQAFRLYSGSMVAGTLLAMMIGLMPQWTFIGTYNNDDSAALLAGTLVLYSLIRLYKKGMTWPNAVWLGMAAGIAILSKPTAWLLLPMLALASVLLARITVKDWLKKAAVSLLVMVLAGGWWIVFNMVHLGWDDPVQAKVVQQVAARHARLNHDLTYSYADKGVGAIDLLLHNHNRFLTKTFVSTIGNLDWMRLRVGPLQYGFYGLLLLSGFILLLRQAIIGNNPKSAQGQRQQILGQLLLLGLITQITGYLLANLYNDIQEQGKYLLPALGLLLLPLSTVLYRQYRKLAATLCRWSCSHFRLYSNCRVQSFLLLGLLVLLIHLQALNTYVIPYYWPPIHHLQVRRMVPFNILAGDIQARHDISFLKVKNGQVELAANGSDPWFILPKPYCKLLHGPNVLFKVRLDASQGGHFSLFWEPKPGAGFSSVDQVSARYKRGISEFIVGIAKSGCNRLRIDPMNHPGKIRILDMAAVRIDVDWPVAP